MTLDGELSDRERAAVEWVREAMETPDRGGASPAPADD